MGGMVDIAVEIDGSFVYAMRADGLIVATPTGSTAYALSAQGPIVHPQVPALLLVPVAPHALSNRPIAVSDSVAITITVLKGKGAIVHADSQAHFPVSDGDRIAIRRAPYAVRLLHPADHDHFAMLRQKLHWGETPEQLGRLMRRRSPAPSGAGPGSPPATCLGRPGLTLRPPMLRLLSIRNFVVVEALDLELDRRVHRPDRRDRRREVDPARRARRCC